MGTPGSRKRTLLWWLSIAAFVILAIPALIIAFLSSRPAEALVRLAAERALERALHRPVDIGRLRTNLVSRIRLEKVRIGPRSDGPAAAGSAGQEPALALDSALAEYRLLPLLRGELRIGRIELAELRLAVDELAGRAEAAREPPEGRARGALLPVRVRVEKLRLESARFFSGGTELVVNRAELGPLAVDERSLSAENLLLSLPGMEVAGRAAARREGGRWPLAGRLQVRGDPAPLLAGLRVPLQGRLLLRQDLALAADLSGDLTRPQADILGDLPAMEVAGFPLTGGRLRARWAGDRLALEGLEIRATEGTLRASAILRVGPWRLEDLQVQVERFALASLWPALYGEPSPFRGTLEARLTASGAVEDPAADAQLHLRDLRYRGTALAPVAVRVSYRGGTAQGALTQEATSVTFRLQAGRKALSGRFDARIAQLEPIAALLRVYGLTGSLRADGTLEGSWDLPRIQARVSGRSIRYAGFPVDTLEAGLQAGFSGTASGVAGGGAAAPGRWRLVFSRLQAAGNLSAVDLANPPFGLMGLSGAVRYEGSLRGALDNLSGTVTAELRQLAYAGVRLGAGRLAARLREGRIVLDSLRLQRGELQIAASGEFAPRTLEGSLQAELRGPAAGGAPVPPGRLTASLSRQGRTRFQILAAGEGIRLEPLRGLTAAMPDVGGTLAFSAGASGLAFGGAGGSPAPQAEARWEISDPRFQAIRMTGLRGRLTLRGNRLEIEEVDLAGPGARFQASASIGLETGNGRGRLSPRSPFSGRVRGENVDLGIVAPFLPAGMQAGGILSCEISWRGTLQAPEPTGTLSVSGGTFRLGPGAPPVGQVRLAAAFHGSTLTLQQLNATVQEVPVSLQGTLQTSDWRRVRLELNAALSRWGAVEASGTLSPEQIELDSRIRSLNLEIAGLFLPDLQSLRGTLTGTLSVRGKPADPQITGTAEASDLALRIPGFPEPLSGGAFHLSFQGRQVTVESLSAQLGSGMLTAAGTLSYGRGGLERSDLKIGLRGLVIRRPGVYSLSVRSATLRYFGEGDRYSLEGDVTPGDSRFFQNIQPQTLIVYLRSLERPSQPMPLFLAKTRLNVRLRGADNLRMQNNLGQLRLRAVLTILGTPTRPAFAGRATVTEGYLLFLDRRFTIERGTVDFADTRRLNPVIDLEARTEVKYFQELKLVPFRIALTLRGPLDSLEVGLDSEPPLTRANIISLLALGAIRPETDGGLIEERSTGQILMERAGELASEQVTRYVGESVKDLLGLDQFSVTGNLFNLGRHQNNPELTASKKINDRLELSYSTNIGPFDQHDLSMDYKLSDNMSLEGKLNQAGEAELRLKFGIKLK